MSLTKEDRDWIAAQIQQHAGPTLAQTRDIIPEEVNQRLSQSEARSVKAHEAIGQRIAELETHFDKRFDDLERSLKGRD